MQFSLRQMRIARHSSNEIRTCPFHLSGGCLKHSAARFVLRHFTLSRVEPISKEVTVTVVTDRPNK